VVADGRLAYSPVLAAINRQRIGRGRFNGVDVGERAEVPILDG